MIWRNNYTIMILDKVYFSFIYIIADIYLFIKHVLSQKDLRK